MKLTRLITARLIDLAFVLICVSMIVFAMIRLIPGDAVAIMLGANTEVTPDKIAALRAQIGLDQPIATQYLGWVGRALHGDLIEHLARRPDAWAERLGRLAARGWARDLAREQARPDMALRGVLGQPVIQQHRERLAGAADGPVQLRRQIVEPALLQPALHIRVELVVLAEAGHARRPPLGPADAKRADAQPQPRLARAHRALQRLHQRIHIRAAPVVARQRAAAGSMTEAELVREVLRGP